MRIHVTLQHIKSTKNTEVFSSTDPDAAVTTLYVQKHSIEGEVPVEIELYITDEPHNLGEEQ